MTTLCDDLPPVPAAEYDALARPSVDDLARQIGYLSPRGLAWQTDEYAPDPGERSVLQEFWRVLATPLKAFYETAWDLAMAARPSSGSVETLVDWERDYGLPDSCLPANDTEAARRAAIRTRQLLAYTARPAEIVCLARQLGYEARVIEFAPFECGRSECGGSDGLCDIGTHWRIDILGGTVEYFEAGSGVVGQTPLGSVVGEEYLSCYLVRIAPAHTKVTVRFVTGKSFDSTAITFDSTLSTFDTQFGDF